MCVGGGEVELDTKEGCRTSAARGFRNQWHTAWAVNFEGSKYGQGVSSNVA